MTTVAPAVALPSQEARERTSPYQGLEPYSEEDAAYFFGRSAWREIIADHLCGYRVTVLYGASGVGKSSVLHAGVVDELRRQARRNSEVSGRPESLPAILSRWSSDPLVSLTEAIQSGAAAIAPELADDPPQGSLAEVLTAWSQRVGGHVLVILDQFDEYFTYYERSAGGSAFADELVEAVENRDVPAHFLFSIREDALAKLDLFEDRITDLWQNLLRIEHLDREAAREAIERPVERWNEREAAQGEPIELEPGLVEAVLSEAEPTSVRADKTGHGRVELVDDDRADHDLVEAPYLQLVMSRLWEEECGSGGRAIRVATLRRLGGGDRIFRRHFDSVMKSLPRRQRSVAARIFQYLVTPNGTKIALPPSALAKWAKQKESRVASVLKTLAGGERRILRTVASATDGDAETSYEIFHDRLAAGILDWRRRYGRKRTIRRILLLAVPPLAIALIAAIGVIRMQQNDNAGLTKQSAILSDRVQDLELESAARSSPLFGAILPSQKDRVNSVAVSKDGGIVTTSDDGNLVLWRSNVRGGEVRVDKVRASIAEFPHLASFSPNGQLLGAETGEATAAVWGPDGKQLFAVPASSLAFTPDGGRILTTLDRTAQLRDARTGNSVATFRSPEPLYAAMMRSGSPQTVVTVGTTKARVWDVAQPGRPVSTFGTTKRLAYAALSPDGVSVLTVSPNDSRLWNVSSHKSIRVGGAGPEPGAGAEFDSALADFASDGRFAIAGRSEVPVFDRGGERLVMLRGHTTPTSVVRFSPDGQFVATGATGGGVRIWDAATGGSRAVLDAHQDAVSALAFSPNGRLLVTAASDGTVVVWLLDFVRDQRLVTQTAQRSPNFVAMLPSHEDRVTDAAFSPDGTRIVTASDDGTVTVSPATPSGAMRVAEAERVINVGSSAALATFSANGLLVGVETSDGWAGVWDATRKRAHVDATSDFISLAFTPDGRSVLTALDDGSAHLWDVRSEKSVAAFRAPEEEPLATASLSRDGRLLVTTGVSIARVWDTERRVQLGAPFRVDGDTVYAVFSPDGRSLLTVCAGDARLWSLGNRRQVALEGGGPVDEFGESGYSLAGVADFARDGRIALAGRRTVALFDERGAPLATLRGHTAETTIVRFSRDARLVATAGLDRTARIWDANTGQSLAILKGHRNDLNALAFSPDGKLLVTAASDGTAIVWRVPTR